ncbi:peptidylprolyl isomerase [Sphingomonas sp. BK235]|uniref:peptidylprolyl isomerase n=1 Tax=Sphingomonas sp. BK235 TaxID=2512131 RepID=UPI00104C55B5|nr:peptidylprolyl isomerase [Sphingomonas sp. BK235]TCP37037.1 peptidyl-prolyl cis-trans isomerase A (cyclophilin A) [Sphingomonas sp. BK235]
MIAALALLLAAQGAPAGQSDATAAQVPVAPPAGQAPEASPATTTPPPAAAPAAPADLAALTRVRLTTQAGEILVGVDTKAAPVTAANFLRYVDQHKLDGIGFYRAVKVADGYGLAQFGTRNDPKRTLPAIKHEPTTLTRLSHRDGTLSMAMAAPGTAAGDFFITVGDLSSMDATPDNPGFAAFGRVIEGMDVVRRILAAPTSPTLGEGVMKGQMLAPVITITAARRVD